MKQTARKRTRKRKNDQLIVRLSSEEKKKLFHICDELGMTISELVRFRVVNLTEREVEAIGKGRYIITPSGVRLAE